MSEKHFASMLLLILILHLLSLEIKMFKSFFFALNAKISNIDNVTSVFFIPLFIFWLIFF